MIPRKAKRDASEPEIVNTLRQCGAYVWRMDQPVDLLISFRGGMWLAECKTGKGKLNQNQERFVDEWSGPPVVILRSAQDAIDFMVEISKGKAA